MADTIQIAYKDKNGKVSYETVSSSSGYLNRYYELTGQTTATLKEITDNNKDSSYETLSSQALTYVANRKPGKLATSRNENGKLRKASTLARSGDVDRSLMTANSYPKKIGTNTTTGRDIYDYTINIQSSLIEDVKKIKRNLNIPSAYSRLELNQLFHEKFNRFRIQYPDYFMNSTVGFVVFTRPDINIVKSNGEMKAQVANDSQLYYLMKASPNTAKTLTKGYSGRHYFNPLLSNTVMSLDVSDESIDTLETGETFTGFKTQYAKSNIRSMTAGTISVTFPEAYNMSLTHLHQMWCAYESGVYRGSLKPKDKYIWQKELDYACDIYYFLLDSEDFIIRYWCKYTGCFPLNVNKSVYSYSGDTSINHPSLNVTYAYFAREDLSLVNLVEFNNNAKANDTNFKYKADYIPQLGACGNTWSGPPFIAKVKRPTGFSRDADLYVLRFSES